MTKSIAILRLQHLTALQHVISSEETRYYLCGALVEPHKTKPGAVMTATDGHLLTTIFDPSAYCVGEARIWRIRDHIRELKAKATSFKKHYRTGALQPWVRYEELAPNDFRVALAIASNAEEAAEMGWDTAMCVPVGRDTHIDGTFPAYGRVFSALGLERSGASIDAALLARIGKFAADFTNGSKSTPVSLDICDEGGPATFFITHEEVTAAGLVMPMRNGNHFKHHPSWLVEHVERPELGVEAYELEVERAKRANNPTAKAA